MEELSEFKQRLEDHFSHLTKSEKRIASFLLANHDEAAFLPAAELAQRSGVSSATIVRFARAIGYDSFPALRRSLQEIFRTKVTPASRLQRKLADLNTGEGHVLHKILAMELQYLAEAEHTVDPADFDRAVEIISGGCRVFVFGLGPARILADLFQLRLRRFGFPVSVLTVSGRDLLEELLLLRRDDALLATAFHRVTGELVAVLDYAHKIGCPTVLVTDVLGPAFKDKAQVVLSARRGAVSNFHSLTVPMAILNALLLAIAMGRPDKSITYLNKLQALRAESGLDVLPKRV